MINKKAVNSTINRVSPLKIFTSYFMEGRVFFRICISFVHAGEGGRGEVMVPGVPSGGRGNWG